MQQLSITRLGRLSKLRQKKHRDAERMFIVEGEKCVREMTGCFDPITLIATTQWFNENPDDKIINRFSEVLSADAAKMQKLSTMSTAPRVLAVFAMPDEREIKIDRESLYLAIDGVQDPGNMGTIIRTADWFGIRNIFASPTTVDIYNAKTVQATMGSLSRVSVTYTSLPELFHNHPDIPVYGTLLDGIDIYRSDLTKNGFIVMGNEGNGLSDEVRKCVRNRLLIPSFPEGSDHAESLNVGVATALVVAEFRRREMKI